MTKKDGRSRTLPAESRSRWSIERSGEIARKRAEVAAE